MTESGYLVYFLINPLSKQSYIGSTNNLQRRINQHRKLIKGGARYTSKWNGSLEIVMYISGFKNRSNALSFECLSKNKCCLQKPNIINLTNKLPHKRINSYLNTLFMEKFKSMEKELMIHIMPKYEHLFENLQKYDINVCMNKNIE